MVLPAAVVLTFEGLQNNEQVLNFYNGGSGGSGSGPGPNYGITFGSDSLTPRERSFELGQSTPSTKLNLGLINR